MDKDALRRDIRARLAAIPPRMRAQGEELVNALIMADPAFQAAKTVLLYRAKPPELSLVSLTHAAWRAGKHVAFPRVVGERLSLHEVSAWSDLAPGAFGIDEPSAEAPRVLPGDVGLALVPGVAFDQAGGRLGQGGGFYDRLLPQLAGPAWGVAFDEQCIPEVPLEAHDRPVSRVICPADALT